MPKCRRRRRGARGCSVASCARDLGAAPLACADLSSDDLRRTFQRVPRPPVAPLAAAVGEQRRRDAPAEALCSLCDLLCALCGMCDEGTMVTQSSSRSSRSWKLAVPLQEQTAAAKSSSSMMEPNALATWTESAGAEMGARSTKRKRTGVARWIPGLNGAGQAHKGHQPGSAR